MVSRPNWTRDHVSDQYRTSKLDAKFACDCGKSFRPEGFNRCKCGKSWASFVIGSHDKTASQSVLIVRPVAEHRERILAKKAAAEPFFVRIAEGEDPAPVILEKEAAGGWGTTNQPGFQDMPDLEKPKQLPTPKPYNPEDSHYPNVEEKAPVAKPLAPGINKARKTMGFTNESQYKLGWVHAEAELPVDYSANPHYSFVQGYRDCLSTKTAGPPDTSVLDPIFEPKNPRVPNNSDSTNDKPKDLAEETRQMRDDQAKKRDADNELGQSRSDETMADFSGWKTSALLAELNRRLSKEN